MAVLPRWTHQPIETGDDPMDEDELIIWETSVAPDGGDEVEQWHATLASLDADGGWAYTLMESPVLAEDWPTYQPFESGSVSLN
jgi:hypothetical protein